MLPPSLSFAGAQHVIGLSVAMSLRMFGLFVLLPVIAPHAESLPGGRNPFMLGLAVGIYGLTQAALQIPMGVLSDRIDRRMVIAFGLALFASGGVIAYEAVDIGDLVIGRALQGAGAISSSVMALTADLAPEHHRSKSMAIIGIGIGGSFAAAMLLGPPLAAVIGVKSLFAVTAILGGLALVPVFMLPKVQTGVRFPSFRRALISIELWKLNSGIFIVHFALAAMFVVVPLELAATINLQHQWAVYTPAFLLALAASIPLIIRNDHKPHRDATRGIGYLLMAMACATLGLLSENGTWGLGVFLLIFFAGFNALETILPAEVSRTAPTAFRGSAMGIYATCQFSGTFVGALIGAYFYEKTGVDGIGYIAAMLLAAWIVVSFIRKEEK